MKFSFDSFADGSFDYDCKTKNHTCLWLREANMDIGGGTISKEEIDSLTNYPDIDVVTISGLRQDTFEYFIKNYGKQLRAIRFFKNKFVEDWSLLGTLTLFLFQSTHFFIMEYAQEFFFNRVVH